MRRVTSLLLALAACAYGAPAFERIFVMVFENHGFSQVMANKYWQAIAEKGMLLTQSYGVTHPSQPNYVAMIGADIIVKDNNNYDLNMTNLISLCEKGGVTWRTYQENYVPLADGGCNPVKDIKKLYVRKHNPHMSFTDITGNINGCRNIVPSERLEQDIASGDLPKFMFYTPNMMNDGHDSNVTFAGMYLTNWMNKFMSNPVFTRNTLFMMTWDEDEGLENNRVATMMFGPYIKPGTQYTKKITHFSLSRTLEENWNLGSLGREDDKANSFLDVVTTTEPLDKSIFTEAEVRFQQAPYFGRVTNRAQRQQMREQAAEQM